MTFNQYILLFYAFAAGHKQIHGSGDGDLFEYLGNEANVKNGSIFWIDSQPSDYEKGTINNTFDFYIFDFINKDLSNANEVISDSYRIALDFINTMKNFYYQDFFTFRDKTKIEDFVDKFDSEVAGVKFTLTFTSAVITDSCAVPQVSAPIVTGIKT